MKLWLRQSRGEGLGLYIESGGIMHLVYILSTFGNQQIRLRKLDHAQAFSPKDAEGEAVELPKLLEAIKAERCLEDPFAFTLTRRGSVCKE
jgi:hypothetical protein